MPLIAPGITTIGLTSTCDAMHPSSTSLGAPASSLPSALLLASPGDYCDPCEGEPAWLVTAASSRSIASASVRLWSAAVRAARDWASSWQTAHESGVPGTVRAMGCRHAAARR